MSWDVYIVDNDSNEVEFVRSLTYNNSELLQAVGCYHKDLTGHCDTWLQLIPDALIELVFNRGKYIHFEPSNKWGGIDDTVSFLVLLHGACARNHKLKVKWK
jgi:hypothetical protein